VYDDDDDHVILAQSHSNNL